MYLTLPKYLNPEEHEFILKILFFINRTVWENSEMLSVYFCFIFIRISSFQISHIISYGIYSEQTALFPVRNDKDPIEMAIQGYSPCLNSKLDNILWTFPKVKVVHLQFWNRVIVRKYLQSRRFAARYTGPLQEKSQEPDSERSKLNRSKTIPSNGKQWRNGITIPEPGQKFGIKNKILYFYGNRHPSWAARDSLSLWFPLLGSGCCNFSWRSPIELWVKCREYRYSPTLTQSSSGRRTSPAFVIILKIWFHYKSILK